MESILNTQVSVFENYNKSDNPKEINLLTWLTSVKYAEEIKDIRNTQDKELRDIKKGRLPGITPSGTFSYRRQDHFIKHSGFIQFDIDMKENSHIINYGDLKEEICKIRNVAYCGLSVSGTGFWGLIPIAHTNRHAEHFDYIYNSFLALGITIDRKPRNVASLRGYSYDPEAYFNHQAIPLQAYYLPPAPKTVKKYYLASGTSDTKGTFGTSTQDQVEQLINQITQRGIDITEGYDNWLTIGFALASEFGEGGRQYFHDVSSCNSGYSVKNCNKQYTNCLRAKRSGVTIKSFFHLCKQAGVCLERESIGRQPEHTSSQAITKETVKERVIITDTLSIDSSGFLYDRGLTMTGRDFGELIITHFESGDGIVYEILYSKEGELLLPGENEQTVNRLAAFFEKTFRPATLDGEACLLHISHN